MQAYNVTEEEIALVAVKNKLNALDHPCAQLGAKITVEDVMNSEKIVSPVKRYDVSPPSDGAAAVILASEEVARKYTKDPIWIDGVGWNVDSQYWTNRELCYPKYVESAARMAYKMAKIENPRRSLDFAEVYDPFDYKELHHMEGLMLANRGEAPKLTREGVTQRGGEFPVNPSGGLLGVGNPIAAAGMMKVCEVYWQLKGEAGKRQIKNKAERGLAQAWGDLLQCGTVITMKR
jgi:acetyl-CoA C-acetyltransferase